MPEMGGRDFGVHFVGGDLKEGLVADDRFALLLQPACESSFNDAFAHLGHYDVSHLLFSVKSKTLMKWRASAAFTSSIPARTPSRSIEVTGRVKPQGTM